MFFCAVKVGSGMGFVFVAGSLTHEGNSGSSLLGTVPNKYSPPFFFFSDMLETKDL